MCKKVTILFYPCLPLNGPFFIFPGPKLLLVFPTLLTIEDISPYFEKDVGYIFKLFNIFANQIGIASHDFISKIHILFSKNLFPASPKYKSKSSVLLLKLKSIVSLIL